MSPFLPSDRQYEIQNIGSPLLLNNEEMEDGLLSTNLINSPMLRFQELSPPEETDHLGIFWGATAFSSEQEQTHDDANITCKTSISSIAKQSRRSLSTRKRNCTSINTNTIAIDEQKPVASVSGRCTTKAEESEPSSKKHKDEKGSDNVIMTITPDRFSACIPCRRRKIKCIPRGDSHQYLTNGTNDGVCATCIRRKKECFWPNIVAISPSENTTADVTPIVEAMEPSKVDTCSQKNGTVNQEEEEQVDHSVIKTTSSSDECASIMVKEEEETGNTLECIEESYFGLPTPAFGRFGSTPGLSPCSSSSASSFSPATSSFSLPLSPRTDSSFPSPTCPLSPFNNAKILHQSDFFDDSSLYSKYANDQSM